MLGGWLYNIERDGRLNNEMTKKLPRKLKTTFTGIRGPKIAILIPERTTSPRLYRRDVFEFGTVGLLLEI